MQAENSITTERRGNLPLFALPVWVATTVLGFAALAVYAHTPGSDSGAPALWPQEATVDQGTSRFTLLVFIHPKCPCSRSTLEQLQSLGAKTRSAFNCTAVISQPSEIGKIWSDSRMSALLQSMPDIQVVHDPGSAEALLFGARTSGACRLYDPQGRLTYAGGLTASRGHIGDCSATDLLTGIAESRIIDHPGTWELPVYGCPLTGIPPTDSESAGRCCRDSDVSCYNQYTATPQSTTLHQSDTAEAKKNGPSDQEHRTGV